MTPNLTTKVRKIFSDHRRLKHVSMLFAALLLSGCAGKIESQIWGFESDPFGIRIKSYVPEVNSQKLPLTLKVDISANNHFSLASLPKHDPRERVGGFYCGQVYSVYYNITGVFEADMKALLEKHFEKVVPLPKDTNLYSSGVAEGEVLMSVNAHSGLTGVSGFGTTRAWGKGDLFAKTMLIGKVNIGALFTKKTKDWVRFSASGLRHDVTTIDKIVEPEDRNAVTMKAFYQEACQDVPTRLPVLQQEAYEEAMRNFSDQIEKYSRKLRNQ